MPIEYKKNVAAFQDVVGVDEAESLLEWLQHKKTVKVDLAACTHLHTANLQVLIAARPKIIAWPGNLALRGWLEPVLKP